MAADKVHPIGELTLRTLAMPGDTNAAGDIFGGWVMAQMDLACGIRAAERARGRVVTAAVREMSFAAPMKVGDTLSIYTQVARVGRTSMTLKVEAWAQRHLVLGRRPQGGGGLVEERHWVVAQVDNLDIEIATRFCYVGDPLRRFVGETGGAGRADDHRDLGFGHISLL